MNAHAFLPTRVARTGGLLLAAAALAAPANAAAAPTLKADLPCYYPGQQIALSGAGYTPAGDVGRRVYVHYFLDGKRLKTIDLGAVGGRCGDLTRKTRQFPFRPVPAGRYTIRFSGTRLFDPQGFWIGYREVVVPKAKAVH